MATVFLAVQDSLQREVALKVMSPALAADRTFADRFVGEARTIAELNHPNIVSIHDVGVTPDRLHYFSMQLLPGGDLEQRIPDGMPERELLRILLPICSALQHAHERGFVHRDVTPGNVMFDVADQPVLTDFGIATVVSEASRMTATGLSMGTSYYMSPEQARGRQVDARSDIYSLGAVIYEALSGKPPYEGDDSFAVAYAHVYEPVPKLPPRFLRWQELIQRCMAKSSDDRYGSMKEVSAVLEGFLKKTTGDGRRREQQKPDLAVTTPLPIPEMSPSKSGRLRWVGLALGKGPGDWLSGFGPAARRGTAWLRGKLQRLPPAALAGLVAGVVLLGLAAFFAGGSDEADVETPDDAALAVAEASEDAPATLDAGGGTGQVEGSEDLSGLANGTVEPEEEEPLPVLPTVDSTQPDEPVLVDLDESDEALLVESLLNTPQGRARLQSLLDDASAALAANRLTTPADDNAFDLFQSALSLDPDNEVAQAGMEQIIRRYVRLAQRAVDRGRYQSALTLGNRARQVARQITLSDSVAEALDSVEEYGYEQTIARAVEAERVGDRARAGSQYRAAALFKPEDATIAEALARLALPPEPEGPYVERDELMDGGEGPEMLVADGVTMAVRETSVDEFEQFVAATGYDLAESSCRNLESWMRASRKRNWREPGFEQDGDHPVVCVNWNDASAYARWLSDQTGRSYALPSVEQWLETAGDAPEDCSANWGDQTLVAQLRRRKVLDCDDGYPFTAPGGSFPAIAGGVHDLHGNVREWTADCLRERGGSCRQYGVLGTSWLDGERSKFLVAPKGYDPDQRYNSIGFRVVRLEDPADTP